MSTSRGKEVRLSVPAEADHLDTIRLALYGAAVRAGFPYEAIEDLKVAVTEACNHALLQMTNRAEARFRIVYAMDGEAIRVRIGMENGAWKCSQAIGEAAPLADGGPGADAAQLGLYLMQALVDEVNVIQGEDADSEQIELVKYREA